MPGRGRPWRGVGEGNPDRIGTGAIADGSITEADLNTALQSKVNAGGHGIEDEGSPLTDRPDLNFVGAGVTATDDGEKTVVTIPGGGGSLDQENIGTPNDNFWIYDEFFYPTPTDMPHLEHVENSLSVPSNVIGGVIQQSTSASDNNDTRLNTCGAGLVALDGSKKTILRWRARLTVADVNTAFICGLTPNQNGPQSPHPYVNKPGPIIAFFWEGTGNIDTYSTTDSISSNLEQTDTGVAMDTSFHTYEIEFDPAGTPTITYKIDGATVKSQTTNIPTGLFACWIGVQNGTTASRAIITDSWFLFNDR